MPIPIDVKALPCGARWLKADLHVHTPASADIAEKWNDSTPEEALRFAVNSGLDLIAITDHNCASWCDQMVEAAKHFPLTVLPGVEISTPQGHLLAIFDSDFSSAQIEDLLITVGIPRARFGDLGVLSAKSMAETAAHVTQFGGVAIAAHADGNRGFLRMVNAGEERKRIYLSPDLWAIELIDATARDSHQTGSRYPRKMTCVQSSDSWSRGADRHQLDAVGSRYSFLKMGEPSISGLKLALLDPEIRVRLAGDESPVVGCSILGMWVTGGFLDGQRFRFSDQVNCLIGDTGSGKSVSIELLRFGLNQQARVPKIADEVKGLLCQQLNELGAVHILVAKGDTQYLIERAWSEQPKNH